MRTTRKSASKRELIAPKGDKRLIRRDAQGRIKESDDLGRSLSADQRSKAKTAVPKGQGDKGDQKARRSRRERAVGVLQEDEVERSPKQENL
jgi:hypothetical protein